MLGTFQQIFRNYNPTDWLCHSIKSGKKLELQCSSSLQNVTSKCQSRIDNMAKTTFAVAFALASTWAASSCNCHSPTLLTFDLTSRFGQFPQDLEEIQSRTLMIRLWDDFAIPEARIIPIVRRWWTWGKFRCLIIEPHDQDSPYCTWKWQSCHSSTINIGNIMQAIRGSIFTQEVDWVWQQILGCWERVSLKEIVSMSLQWPRFGPNLVVNLGLIRLHGSAWLPTWWWESPRTLHSRHHVRGFHTSCCDTMQPTAGCSMHQSR